MKMMELPSLPITLSNLDALALLLDILRSPDIAERLVDSADAPQIRTVLEWLAARGLVVLSKPGFSRGPGDFINGVARGSVRISFRVDLTDRGHALANLLPVVRP